MSPSRRHSVAVAGLALSAMSAMVFSSGGAYADDPVETGTQKTQRVSATVPTNSVTINVSNDVNLGNVVQASTGALAVGKSTVTVNTNATHGYQLYISGVHNEPDGSTPLYHGGHYDSAQKLDSITSPNNAPAVFTAAGRWGYALSTDASGDYNAAYNQTNNAGSIVERSTIEGLKWRGITSNLGLVTSAGEAGNYSTDVYFGVYVDSDTMGGQYQNSVVYTAIVEGSNQINAYPRAIKSGDTINIVAEYSSRDVHFNANQMTVKFLDGTTQVGLCRNLTITNDGSDGLLEVSCKVDKTGSPVNNKEYDIALSIDLGNGKSYEYKSEKVWKYSFPLNQLTKMQEVSAESCAATPAWTSTADDITLTDDRDGKKYIVRKLADGNCWMVQNLDLDLAFVSGTGTEGTVMGTKKGNTPVAFTKDNTDISSDQWVISAGNKAYETQSSSGNPGTTWDAGGRNGGNNDTYEIRSHSPVSTEPGKDNCFTHTGSTDAATPCNAPTAAGNTTHEGNMYNWPAATAGSYTSRDGETSGRDNTSTGEAPDSICPKGWRLPEGNKVTKANDNKSWYNLLSHYLDLNSMVVDDYGQYQSWVTVNGKSDFERIHEDPISEVRPGFYNYSNGQLDGRGTLGYGWSSTAGSRGRGWYLRISASDVRPGTHVNHRGNGFQVRCVAR